MNKTVAALLLILVAGIALPGLVAADVPTTLNYQGKLTNADGIAVPDGVYGIAFRFYEEATGGAFVFEQERTVQVANGVFDTVIGGDGVAGWPDFASELWLELQVTPPGAAAAEDPLPRQILTSSPFAQNSRTVQDNAITTDKIAEGAVMTGDIGDGQVMTADIGDGQVMTADIGDGEVRTADIANGAVTLKKVKSYQLDYEICPSFPPLSTSTQNEWLDVECGTMTMGPENGKVFYTWGANLQLQWNCTDAAAVSQGSFEMRLLLSGNPQSYMYVDAAATGCKSGKRYLRMPLQENFFQVLAAGQSPDVVVQARFHGESGTGSPKMTVQASSLWAFSVPRP